MPLADNEEANLYHSIGDAQFWYAVSWIAFSEELKERLPEQFSENWQR